MGDGIFIGLAINFYTILGCYLSAWFTVCFLTHSLKRQKDRVLVFSYCITSDHKCSDGEQHLCIVSHSPLVRALAWPNIILGPGCHEAGNHAWGRLGSDRRPWDAHLLAYSRDWQNPVPCIFRAKVPVHCWLSAKVCSWLPEPPIPITWPPPFERPQNTWDPSPAHQVSYFLFCC